MSSLWTPGGEVPVDRGRSGAAGAGPDGPPDAAPGPADGRGPDERLVGDDEALRAQILEMQRRMLEAPAGEVVAEHAMGLYELAALHVSQPEPRLAEARTAIDAFAALVEGLEGRLGPAERALRQALLDLRLAFVQLSDRAGGGPAPTA